MRILFLSGLLAFCSCSLFTDSVLLTLSFPELSEPFNALYSDRRWHVSVFHAEGRDTFAVNGSTAVLVVPACQPLSVTARPVPFRAGFPALLPCGQYLRSNDLVSDTRVELTWEDGILAEVFSDRILLTLGDRINTERLKQGISERCRGNFWALDIAFLRERLSSGNPGYYDIRKKEERTIFLSGDCSLIGNSPLSKYSETEEKVISVYGRRGVLLTGRPVSGWLEYSQGPHDIIIRRHDFKGVAPAELFSRGRALINPLQQY